MPPNSTIWPNPAAGITLRAQFARAYFFTGDAAGAVRVADLVLASSEREDLVALTADTLVTKGTALAEIGRVLEGRGVVEAGVAIAERSGWPAIGLRGRVNLSLPARAQGSPGSPRRRSGRI